MHMIITVSTKDAGREHKFLDWHNMADPGIIFLEYFDLPPDHRHQRPFASRWEAFTKPIRITGDYLDSLKNTHFLPEWWAFYLNSEVLPEVFRRVPIESLQFEVAYDPDVPVEEPTSSDDVSSGQ